MTWIRLCWSLLRGLNTERTLRNLSLSQRITDQFSVLNLIFLIYFHAVSRPLPCLKLSNSLCPLLTVQNKFLYNFSSWYPQLPVYWSIDAIVCCRCRIRSSEWTPFRPRTVATGLRSSLEGLHTIAHLCRVLSLLYSSSQTILVMSVSTGLDTLRHYIVSSSAFIHTFGPYRRLLWKLFVFSLTLYVAVSTT